MKCNVGNVLNGKAAVIRIMPEWDFFVCYANRTDIYPTFLGLCFTCSNIAILIGHTYSRLLQPGGQKKHASNSHLFA